MTARDLIDEMYATVDRRSKLRATVSARLVEVETELAAAIVELREIQESVKRWKNDSSFLRSFEKELPIATARVEALVREHSALEGIIDRQDARRWRVAQFVAGGVVGGAITYLARYLFGN